MSDETRQNRSVRLRLAGGVLMTGTLCFFSGAATGFSLGTKATVAASAQTPVAVHETQAVQVSSLSTCVEDEPVRLALAVQEEPVDEVQRDEPQIDELQVDEQPVAEVLADAVAVAEPGASAERRWTMQVGAFSVEHNAHALASDLKARGYDPLIVAARTRSGQWLQHVRLDVSGDERSAVAKAREFERLESMQVILVAMDSGAPH
jgi:cell division protein FtsN